MSTPASDRYQQNSGVRGVNSGPLVIRTYNDETSNNTFLLGKYEVPISSNCVLITTTGGKLAPSNSIYLSSLTTSTITSNTLILLSTLNIINISVSSLFASTATAHILNASSINTSTIIISTLNSFSSNISTLNVNLTNVSTMNASTITTMFLNYSTLIGSTISTNTVAITSTLTVSTLNASTMNIQFINYSSIIGSTISTNTLAIASTLNVSTITSRSINYSTLTGSSINTQSFAFSTLIGSTISTNTLAVASTITASTLNASGILSIAATTSNLDYTKFGQNWTTISSSQLPATPGYWGAAMSASGQYQVVTYRNGGIYYSSNYGQTWTLSSTSITFYGIAMSASGQYAVACADLTPFNIYISSNYGQTWITTSRALSGASGRIAISASGQYITALCEVSSQIHRSTNYGSSWTLVGSTYIWKSVAISASGQYQLAGSNNAGATCYYSSDYGANWATSTGAPSSTQLFTLAMSASGQYACLAVFTQGLYYSSNYGQNWTASPGGPSNTTIVSISASGQYAIAGTANSGNYLYYSINNGQTWTITTYSAIGNWYGSAMSANGQYLLAINADSLNAQSTTPLLTGPINISNTNVNPTPSLSLLAPNIFASIVPTTTTHGIIIGQATSTYNAFQIVYNHVGVGSTTNYMSIGTYNGINGLNINGAGYVGIGTIAPISLFHVNGDININNMTIGRGNSNVSTNTVMGYQAGYQITTGYNNTLLGYNAGNALTTGYQNICIGSGATASSVSINNEITIGNGLTATSILFITNGTYTYINRTCINGSSNPSRGMKVESYSIPVNTSIIFGFSTGGVFLLTYYPDGLINGQSGGMAVVTNTGFALIGSPLLAPVGGITFVINTPTLACTLTSGLTVGCILSVIQIG